MIEKKQGRERASGEEAEKRNIVATDVIFTAAAAAAADSNAALCAVRECGLGVGGW